MQSKSKPTILQERAHDVQAVGASPRGLRIHVRAEQFRDVEWKSSGSLRRRLISGARVTVTAKATAAARQTSTNYEGLFEVPNLVPGEYSLQVSADGFADQKRDVVLEVGQHMGLDLSLQLGEKYETVSVVASAENLKTQDASIGEVVEPKSIQDLPLNGRMLIDLALTVPDAHVGHGAQTGDMSPLYWRPARGPRSPSAATGPTPTTTCSTASRIRTRRSTP
jgi:hypothetical protein